MLLERLVNYLWDILWIIIFGASVFSFFAIKRKIPKELIKNSSTPNPGSEHMKKIIINSFLLVLRDQWDWGTFLWLSTLCNRVAPALLSGYGSVLF